MAALSKATMKIYNVGLDLYGPFYTNCGSYAVKCYDYIFAWLSTRAVGIETR